MNRVRIQKWLDKTRINQCRRRLLKCRMDVMTIVEARGCEVIKREPPPSN